MPKKQGRRARLTDDERTDARLLDCLDRDGDEWVPWEEVAACMGGELEGWTAAETRKRLGALSASVEVHPGGQKFRKQ